MNQFLSVSAALLLTAHFAQAQTADPGPINTAAAGLKQPLPPRARGIPTSLAVEGAVEANAVCLHETYRTTAVIADSAGVPIVMISNDGANAITQRVAMEKIQAVIKYKMDSGMVAEQAKVNASLAAEIQANPMIETARAGGLQIKAGGDVVGVISVSGAPGPIKDEACARAGLAKIQGHVQ